MLRRESKNLSFQTKFATSYLLSYASIGWTSGRSQTIGRTDHLLWYLKLWRQMYPVLVYRVKQTGLVWYLKLWRQMYERTLSVKFLYKSQLMEPISTHENVEYFLLLELNFDLEPLFVHIRR